MTICKKNGLDKIFTGVTYFSLIVLYAPIATIAVNSVTKGPLPGRPHFGETLALYRAMIENESLLSALSVSLTVAFTSASLATVFGSIAALALRANPGRILTAIVLTPIGVPEIIQGISLLILFSCLGFALGPWTVILGHAALATSFVAVVIAAQFARFDNRLLDAAADLGASPFQRLWHITLPLLRPGIWSGFLVAGLLSLDDFIISFFTTGAGFETLPIAIYSMIKFGLNPEVYALSVIIQVLTGIVSLVVINRTAFTVVK